MTRKERGGSGWRAGAAAGGGAQRLGAPTSAGMPGCYFKTIWRGFFFELLLHLCWETFFGSFCMDVLMPGDVKSMQNSANVVQNTGVTQIRKVCFGMQLLGVKSQRVILVIN